MAGYENSKQSVAFLLNLNATKISKIENALERNWLVHVILAAVGIAMVFNVGHLRDVLAKYFAQKEYNAQAVAAIVLPVFLYHFMRLGQLVTAFNEARQLREELLKDYLGGASHSSHLESLHASTSFLAESFARTTNWAYLLVTSAIVSIAQASALFLVVQAYGVNRFSVAVLVASAIVLLILYFIFWSSQKDRRRATVVLIVGLVFFVIIAGLLVSFAR